jgi:tRNA(Ile)-lysidine synthase
VTDAVEAAAFAALDQHLDAESGAPLAVAVSGGGDSVALLELTADWGRRCGRQVRVLHVDHGLSPDSGRWARDVQAHADRLSLTCDVLAWAGAKPANGLPAAARAARHALLAEAARACGARVILMGHTADDLREGEQMRLDGSSLGRVRTWGPSPAWPEGRGVMLLRPVLGVTRGQLRNWLNERGLPWIEDPANVDPRFARARARSAPRDVETPPEPALSPAAGLVEDAGLGLLRTHRDTWLGLQPGDAVRLLSTLLLCAGGGARPPRSEALRRLLDALASGTEAATLAGARAYAVGDWFWFGRDPGRIGLPAWPTAAHDTIVWDGRLEVRSEAAGRVLALAGRARSLAPLDREVVRTLPAPFRATTAAIEMEGALRLASGTWLPYARLLAALGAVRRERDLSA